MSNFKTKWVSKANNKHQAELLTLQFYDFFNIDVAK